MENLTHVPSENQKLRTDFLYVTDLQNTVNIRIFLNNRELVRGNQPWEILLMVSRVMNKK